MKKIQFTIDEDNYLINNYSLIGPTKSKININNILNIDRTIDFVKLRARKLNLRFNRKYKYPDINLFTKIDKKEISYIMGILWADGFINKGSVGLEISKDDMLDLEKVFLSVGEWCQSDRVRKNRKKIMSCIQYCSTKIVEIFKSYNYHNKSLESPDFNQMNIKDEFIRYFIRGIIDGDGCIYHNKNQVQIHIASTYNQNWQYLIDIASSVGFTYNIRRIKSKSSYSIFYLGGYKNSLKFLNWIYSDYDGIGLKRKYNKYLQIKNHQTNSSTITISLIPNR